MLHFTSIEEEVYRPVASYRLYDYNSDESLNRYEQECFNVPMFQPTPNFCNYGSSDRLFQPRLTQRRHSSFSHEDILNMKFQNPPVDPRYRDNRPFVHSNSSLYDHARRDFMSRRRSSSSLQDDMLRPFHQSPLDSFLRKSNPSIHNNSTPSLSEKCNSNWNLNPSIYIEEYNDNAAEVKSNNSSTNLSYTEPHQPLNEESVAPFAGCDEIPFIDDEHAERNDSSHYCDYFMPVVNCVEQQHQFHSEKPSYMKNRKTVSFDLVDSNEELNKIRRSHLLNKSNTCDHITNIRFSEARRPMNRSSPPTKPPLEPLFKLCTLKNSNIPNEPTESFNKHTNVDDNDSFSAYLQYTSNRQDQLHLDTKEPEKKAESIIDPKSFLLDLSELNSDSTCSSSQTETSEIKSTSINPSYVNKPVVPGDKFAYIPTWKPPQFYDHIAYGNGKVRALKSYFEGLKMTVKHLSDSSPNLSKNPDKLSAAERDSVLEQLREWSEFGSNSQTTHVAQAQSNKAIQTNPVTRSVLNLTVTTSYNNPDKGLEVATRSSSVPDVNEYVLTDDMLLPTKKKDVVPPSKQASCANITTTHKITKSCPNLCRNTNNERPYYVSSRLHTSIYNSPCHRSTNLTVRKVKQIQKNVKRSKFCKAKTECTFQSSDNGDEAR